MTLFTSHRKLKEVAYNYVLLGYKLSSFTLQKLFGV
jgi:hypothetical protein